VRSLLLTGQYGAGKTAVAAEITHILSEHGQRSAAIDLDWLAWVGPDLDESAMSRLRSANLAALVRAFRSEGVERVVVAGTVRTGADVELVRLATQPSRLCVIRLQVPDDEAVARIRGRDVGRERVELLGDCAEVAAVVAATQFHDFDVANPNQRPIDEVAWEVLRRAGWDTSLPPAP
jgi:thymidylate kinase